VWCEIQMSLRIFVAEVISICFVLSRAKKLSMDEVRWMDMPKVDLPTSQDFWHVALRRPHPAIHRDLR
jgi:hypothetical protein